MAQRSGGCMCGAVRYEASDAPDKFGACHCQMCRKWSGGVFMGIEIQPDVMEFTGTQHIKVFASSSWAERAFCNVCGGNLYYRITAEGPYHGVYHMAAGTLDDHSGLRMSHELYIDVKPEAYGFAQETRTMTQAEVEALFAPN